nr:hypothetical protein Ade03nite_40130 [Actinoplanes derwentensis]
MASHGDSYSDGGAAEDSINGHTCKNDFARTDGRAEQETVRGTSSRLSHDLHTQWAIDQIRVVCCWETAGEYPTIVATRPMDCGL